MLAQQKTKHSKELLVLAWDIVKHESEVNHLFHVIQYKQILCVDINTIL